MATALKGTLKGMIILLFLLASAIMANAHDCRSLFRQRVVVQHHVPYVAPYVQQLYYQVGVPLEIEALVERKLEQRLAQLTQMNQVPSKPQLGLSQKSPVQAPLQAPMPLQTLTVMQTKCAKCHNSTKQSGDLILDGSEYVTDATYRKFHKMAGLGIGVPAPMKGLIESLSVEDKGKLTEEMLQLEAPEVQAPEVKPPEVLPEVPAPVPQGDLE